MIAFRPAVPEDEPFLLDMLWLAFHWRDEAAAAGTWPDPEAPRRYLAGFGRAGDAGVIAEADGVPVGAAWYRVLPAEDAGYGYVEGVPELTVAVAAAHRARGIARGLIERLLDRAREDGFPGVSLSVEPDNPARGLYERLGFERAGAVGGAWTLLRRL
jgi:ribosomal protein S18 acetylase RimI-like enzyme